ncbi:MAG TPA: hypothetical protein VIL16_17255 [Trebonia sp.]
MTTRFTLWLPPNVWLHGSQSTITGRSAARNGHACRIICWLAASIRWVLITPLGVPVDPEVNRILATASPSSLSNASCPVGPGSVSSRSASCSEPGLVSRLTMAAISGRASSAGPNRPASSANTAPGRISSAIALIRAWSRLCSEYATLTGATGTPAVIAPSVTSR